MESIKKTVGANLKKVCKSKGIKNYQIADFLGVTESSVSHWFCGDNSIDIDNLYRLCQHIGVSLDQIFGIEKIIPDVLNEEECELLKAYRKVDPNVKNTIRGALRLPEIKKDHTSSVV